MPSMIMDVKVQDPTPRDRDQFRGNYSRPGGQGIPSWEMQGRPSNKREEVSAMGEAGEEHLRQKEQQVQGLSGSKVGNA